MTNNITRVITVTGLTVLLSVSALMPSFAGAEGRRNTALILTAIAVNEHSKQNHKSAVILDLAAAQAWKNYANYRDYGWNHRHYGYDNRRYPDYRYDSGYRYDRGDRYDSDRKYKSYDKKRGYSQPRGRANGHDKRVWVY